MFVLFSQMTDIAAFITAYILTCDSGKSAGVHNNISNDLFKCPSKPCVTSVK